MFSLFGTQAGTDEELERTRCEIFQPTHRSRQDLAVEFLCQCGREPLVRADRSKLFDPFDEPTEHWNSQKRREGPVLLDRIRAGTEKRNEQIIWMFGFLQWPSQFQRLCGEIGKEPLQVGVQRDGI